jgi:hypothetical protein
LLPAFALGLFFKARWVAYVLLCKGIPLKHRVFLAQARRLK